MDIKNLLSQDFKTTFKQDSTCMFQSVRANSYCTVQCEIPCNRISGHSEKSICTYFFLCFCMFFTTVTCYILNVKGKNDSV